MRILSFLAMYVFTIKIKGDDKHEIDRENVLEKHLRTGLPIFPDYQLVTRQLATDVYTYESYKSVSLMFYPINKEVTEAHFTFQASELHLNAFGSCSPNEVIINLKHSSYPAVNPDGYDFPKDFIDMSRREQVHSLELMSNAKNVTYTIENPMPGIWYCLTYVKWEDPKKQKIVQKGFDAECQTLLYSHLQVKLEEYIIQIDCYSDKTIDSYVPPALFKCMSLASCDTISLSIKNTDYRKLYIGIAAMSIPTEDDNIVYCALDTSDSSQVVTFTPHPSAWHYIEIGVFEGNISRIPDCKSYYARSRLDEFVNYTIVDLMRVDKGRFFSFDYMLPSNDPHNDISLINITSSEIKSLRFKINQFVDIGGNLLISASFLINLRYFVGYGTEPEKQPLVSFTHDNQFLKAVICMDIGHPSTPLHSGHCKYNDKVTPALFVLYSVDSDSFYDKKYIPFPESGTWYLTLRIFCDAAAGPCKTVENGSIHYVDTSLDKEDDSIFISSEGNRTSCESTSECSTNIALVISSMPCVYRRCNNHGDCRLRAFGGLVMSFCSCFDGYGSWDCSDPRRMDSRTSILTAVLLLTLSNLLFILSIYVAIIRLYYTEAMVYTFTMFFSTFYHACDAPKQVALCICQHRILQFGDFYCAILSFWVTLLAVSIISDKFRSLLHLIGAVFAPILLAWNMFSFVPFTLLATTGLVILLISWYLDYRTNRIMKYAKSYYLVYMPMGLILVSIGFICFAFLQTERNYHIVHSVWHLIVASSVVLLLPDVRRGPNENAFLPSQIGKYFHKARSSPPSS